MSDREFIAVFHYDNGGTNRCGAEPYRYAEEIVRCKECKHCRPEGNTTQFFWCHYWMKPTDENRYCSDGERKESE